MTASRAAAIGDDRQRYARGELCLNDLFLSFERCGALLDTEATAGRWLDAFLLAAGSLQLLEDHLHGDPLSMGRAANFLDETGRGWARAAARAGRVAVAAWVAATARRPAVRRLRAHRDRLARLVTLLASAVLSDTGVDDAAARGFATQANALGTASLRCPIRLRRSLLRLPSCFRSFDQHPDDVEELMVRFAKRWPDRTHPVAVVGLRTSGSYLGPLAVAALERHGYHDVRHLSVRPETYLRREEARELAAVVEHGGIVMLIDDPPTTGGSLAAAAALIERAGVPRSSIMIALCLFGDERDVPARLASYEMVTIGWPDWRVHRAFDPEALAPTVSELLPAGVELASLGAVAGAHHDRPREHARRWFTMNVGDRRGGAERATMTLLVEGTGLGLFGRHAVAVARAIPARTPAVLGFADGLLFSTVDGAVPGGAGTGASGASPHATRADDIAEYVVQRERALPAAADRSHALLGRQPVWEVAANLLCATMGRAGFALRMPLVDPIVRQLTSVATPSIIDGRMSRDRWLCAGDAAPARKLEYAEGAFSHRDLVCYDAVFDLAGAAADLEVDVDVGERHSCVRDELRARYESASGRTVDDERWLIYSLVHQWDRRRLGEGASHECDQAMARALQRYLAAQYLADTALSPDGPLVAIDIDGVLECGPLGVPATTGRGAAALRALVVHGYRPLLASGRSLDEVRDRCHTYGLPGGVAEYGTALYDAHSRTPVVLLSESDRATMSAVRDVLSHTAGVELDETYTHCVRAFRRDRDRKARRRGLGETTIAELEAAVGPMRSLTIVRGMAQTDIVPGDHTKASGLRALGQRLRAAGGDAPPGNGALLALAVGDSEADLAMFALAARAVAPANAAREVRRSGSCRVARHGYQAGLADAVEMLIGHRPGDCVQCAAPLRPGARQLVALLSIQEAGGAGMPRRVAALAGRALKARW